MSKILLTCNPAVFTEEGMAYMSTLRVWEMARALARRGHEVIIAEKKHKNDYVKDNVYITGWKREIAKLISECDVVITRSPSIAKNNKKPTIIDLCAPSMIETLNTLTILQHKKRTELVFQNNLFNVKSLLENGDYFICLGKRQKFFYLGMLAMVGRINPDTDLNKIIEIVPTGIPPEKPFLQLRKNIIKGTIISPERKVILWPSGISPWFDAITPIKAMKIIVEKVPDAALVFVGPINPICPDISKQGYQQAHKMAEEMNLLNKFVYFTSWLPYHERAAMYFESDLAVITYSKGLEAELSWRTRIVDCLWGKLPVICTRGDEVSEYIKEYNAGELVEAGDVKGLANKIIKLLIDTNKLKQMRKNISRCIKEKLSWDVVIEPIDRFCRDPFIAKDKKNPIVRKIKYLPEITRFTTYISLKCSTAIMGCKEEGMNFLFRRIFRSRP